MLRPFGTTCQLMDRPETPPLSEQFEVSLFGPGFGESIAVHLGYGDWAVVDSCRDPRTRQPVALDYLNSLGVDVSQAVKLIVLTHWHDDHIRGAADLFERAASAQVAWSSKYHDDAFYEAVETARESRLDDTGFDEMSRVLRILMERRDPKQRPESVGPKWAGEGTLLFRRSRTGTTKKFAQVMALSPSHGTQTLTRHELSAFLPEVGAPQRRAVRVTPNQLSVVLAVEAGDRNVLLGSDLEDSPNPAVGWKAVVNSDVRPQARSEVFKVPHHGSKNAHNSGVWADMLAAEPIACLTPFSRGSSPLPSSADIRRLLQHSSQVFCTRPPRSTKPRRRSAPVDRTIREVARRHRVVEGRLGHIRIRGALRGDSPLDVNLYGAAYQARP